MQDASSTVFNCIQGTLASDVLFQAYVVDGLHRWNDDRGRAATSTPTDHQSYSGLLRHTANVLGMKVLKRKIAPTYNEPRKYTGELIGIEYLYSQTGKVLDDYMKAIETLETTPEDDVINTEEDDEVLQDADQIDDLTISTDGLKESSDFVVEAPVVQPMAQVVEPPHPSSSETQAGMLLSEIPVPEVEDSVRRDSVNIHTMEPSDPVSTPVIKDQSSSEAESDSESEESVGPDSIPGYGRVQELAEYLVNLRHALYLTNAQFNNLIQLWNNLSEYDKAPTVFEERFSKEARGRYKAKNSVRNVVPGVESTERSMRGGPGAVPASWPSANRYTEAIIIRLLSILPRNRTRFDDVTRAYYDIRQLVLQNGKVVAETNIQLPEISRGTLTQWYTKRGKALDKLVVTQGLRFDQPPRTTSLGIPAAVDKPVTLPTGKAEPHSFPLPTNTAGLARMKGQKKKSLKRSTTQSTPAQTTVPAFAPVSASPLTTPKSTSYATAQSTYYPSASQLTNPNTVPNSSYPPLTFPQSAYPLTAPQLTCSFIAPQSTCSIPVTQPCSVLDPQPSALVFSPQSACIVSAQQSTPAGPAQQSATSFAPLNIHGQPYQSTQASEAQDTSDGQSYVPYTTQRYRKRKLEKEQEGIFKRKYERKKVPTCRHCGQERTPPSHLQYFMNWFCGATATVSFEDWKETMIQKGYGRKPKPP